MVKLKTGDCGRVCLDAIRPYYNDELVNTDGESVEDMEWLFFVVEKDWIQVEGTEYGCSRQNPKLDIELRDDIGLVIWEM